MDETCFHCGRAIEYSDKFGIYAYRHSGSGSEFCRSDKNSILRASPDGSETR